MLITNFVSGDKNLFTLWNGDSNIKAWTNIENVPKKYYDMATVAKRIQITDSQWDKLFNELAEK